MDLQARKGAQATWGYRQCGTVEGQFSSHLGYFHEVERKRYEAYPWLYRLLYELGVGGKRVLEIGPGQGTDLVQFVEQGAECEAVDITEAHLQSTARNFGCRGLKTPVLWKMDATELPFHDKQVDLVFMNGVLHHIPEADEVVAEVKRVLKPSGLFVFLVYNKWSWFNLYRTLRRSPLWAIEEGADGKDRKPYIKLYTKRDLSRLLEGWKWSSTTQCGSPMPDWACGKSLGGWFHVVYARKP